MRSLLICLALVCLIGWVDQVTAEEPAGTENICTKRQAGEHICPELFILGVQKGASRSLWTWILTKHEIEVPSKQGSHVKELHFFDKVAEVTEGVDEYARNFPIREKESDLAMDGTSNYFHQVACASRMHTALPVKNLRFIVSFRDPFDRARSWYEHATRNLVSTNKYFRLGFAAFENKFSLMEEFVMPLLAECMKATSKYDGQYDICARPGRYADKIIPSTGKANVVFVVVLQLFSGGLYGPLMRHWFRYFEPHQFCLVAFENLLSNFEREIQHLSPCMEAFGRELQTQGGEELPQAFNQVDHTDDKLVEMLTPDELRFMRLRWNTEIYGSSNRLLRTMLLQLYLRDDFPIWEETDS